MLKRLEKDGAARPAAAQRACERLPAKVLIAEDNVVSQQAARRFLEAIGSQMERQPWMSAPARNSRSC